MTNNKKDTFFFTVNSNSVELNDQFLNNISEYGIHFFFGISKGYDSDIMCINAANRNFSKIEKFNYQDMKFNSNYFSHLPDSNTFSKEQFTNDEESDIIEQQFTLSKIDVISNTGDAFEIKIFKDPQKHLSEEPEKTFEEFFDLIVSSSQLSQIH